MAAIIYIPLRMYSILNDATVKAPLGIESQMGSSFNYPMIKPESTIELTRKKPGFEFDLIYSITGPLRSWGAMELFPNKKVLIPYSDSPLELNFKFCDWFTALAELWRGEAAWIETKGYVERKWTGEPGNKDKKWDSSVSAKWYETSPYFDISLPFDSVNTTEQIDNRRILVNVGMTVTYPISTSAGGFENRTTGLNYQFEALLLSPEETTQYEKIRKEYRSKISKRTFLIYGTIFIAPFTIFLYLYAERRGIKIFKKPKS